VCRYLPVAGAIAGAILLALISVWRLLQFGVGYVWLLIPTALVCAAIFVISMRVTSRGFSDALRVASTLRDNAEAPVVFVAWMEIDTRRVVRIAGNSPVKLKHAAVSVDAEGIKIWTGPSSDPEVAATIDAELVAHVSVEPYIHGGPWANAIGIQLRGLSRKCTLIVWDESHRKSPRGIYEREPLKVIAAESNRVLQTIRT
jgi:hypothetical protein